jgi:hypothetical protein
VFYSPTITTGVSFVLKDIKQTHFMYFTTKPKITPISGYQMSCRTRNMKELIYYSSEIRPTKMKHETIEEIESDYKKMIKYNNRLMGISSSRDENDDVKIVNNIFFKLFTYNQYQDEIFGTGFITHYENILTRDGFVLSEKGQTKKLNNDEKAEFKNLYEEFQDEKFDEFADLYFNIREESDIEELKKYKVLNDRVLLLNLPSKEDIIKYRVFLVDEYALRNYYSLLNLLKTLDYIKDKQLKKRKDSFEVKTLSSSFNKVLLLYKFEQHYKIERFNFNFENIDPSNEISDKFKELYESISPKRTTKKYNSKSELLKVYVNIIKNICGDIPIITSKRIKKDGKNSYEYKIDKVVLKDIILLAKFKNPTLKKYNQELIERLTEIKPELKKKNDFLDDNCDEDNAYNNYEFNKNTYKQGIYDSVVKNDNLINIDNEYLDL